MRALNLTGRRGIIMTVLVSAAAFFGAAGLADAAWGAVTDNIYKTANYSPDCHDSRIANLDDAVFCQTDNNAVSIWREGSMSATGKSDIGWTWSNSYNSTDLNVNYPSSPRYSGEGETDIIYRQQDISDTGLDGVTFCEDAQTDTKCDQAYVTFDSATPGRALTCHETGHAVGLTHGREASPRLDQQDDRLFCMKQLADTPYLGPNNRENINSVY